MMPSKRALDSTDSTAGHTSHMRTRVSDHWVLLSVLSMTRQKRELWLKLGDAA